MKYDVVEYERLIRASMAESKEQSAAAIEAGTMDPDLHHAQTHFEEAIIQFALAGARAANELPDMAVTAAAGAAIGMMIATATGEVSEEEEQLFYDWIARATADAMALADGEEVDDAITDTVFTPTATEQ